MILFLMLACSPASHHNKGSSDGADGTTTTDSSALLDRAYVVSELSNELFVFDYETLDEVGSIDTSVVADTPNGNHMAMVSMDGKTVYISAAETGKLLVVDAASLTIKSTIDIGTTDTHMAFRDGTNELWIMVEGDNAVAIVDTETNTLTRKITDESFHIPHFARFSGDYAYIPSIGGNQVSVVDLASYSVVDTLVPDGLTEGACDGDPCGFADAQIDPEGMLFASHFSTGKVLVYDTVNHEMVGQPTVGLQTWSAFVDPFAGDDNAALAPSWADETVTHIGADAVASAWDAGDSQVYGVNYSPTSLDEAFVLHRTSHSVGVVSRSTGELVDEIDAGGTTETAATTPDGLLLLPVSSTGEVAVIDTATHEELTRYSDVGTYPWSATTAAGQNYCH